MHKFVIFEFCEFYYFVVITISELENLKLSYQVIL